MEEILKILDTNRNNWEYRFGGFIKQLTSYDKDDIYNEVFIKVSKQYEKGKIDMDTLEDYMFITYRNTLIGLCSRKNNQRNNFIEYDDDIRENISEGEDYIEYFNEDSPIRKKIKEIIGDDNFNELIHWYKYKIAPKSQKHLYLNPKTQKPFTYKDQRRHQQYRRKLRFFFNQNKKN